MAIILCVEDESDIQTDLVDELTDAGHTVTTATTGAEGLEAIAKQQFDLIICDSLMPVMTGPEFFRRLRTDHPNYNHVPFVFVSAHADRTHVEEGLEHGASAYLTKPVDFDVLMDTIEGLLAKTLPANGQPGGDVSQPLPSTTRS